MMDTAKVGNMRGLSETSSAVVQNANQVSKKRQYLGEFKQNSKGAK